MENNSVNKNCKMLFLDIDKIRIVTFTQYLNNEDFYFSKELHHKKLWPKDLWKIF